MNLSRPTMTVARARPVPTKLVELVPASSAPIMGRRYVVRIGDSAAVEIGDDFDAATLRRILEVLRAC